MVIEKESVIHRVETTNNKTVLYYKSAKKMRRGKKPTVEEYLKVRLTFLYAEKKKNNDNVAHLVLDKAIYELSIVLDMISRAKKPD